MKKSKKTIFKCVSALALMLSMVSVGGNIVSAGPVITDVKDTRIDYLSNNGTVLSSEYTYKDLNTPTGGYMISKITQIGESSKKNTYKYHYKVW